MKNLLIICLILLSFAVITHAQSGSDERDKMILSGIKNVSVTAYVDNNKLLNPSQIRSDVELEISRAGIKIDNSAPLSIYIRILTVTNDDKSISYTVILYLDENVILQRNSQVKIVGTVLDISGIYTTKSENFNLDVRKKVLGVVDTFLRRHKKAN